MAKTALEKMLLRPHHRAAILHAPADLQELFDQETRADREIDGGSYDFILSFFIAAEAANGEAQSLKQALARNGMLWIAYPKGRALNTDLNRDTLHAAMAARGLTGVSLISIDGTWSAMRFKIG
jgi:hypothetical protein